MQNPLKQFIGKLAGGFSEKAAGPITTSRELLMELFGGGQSTAGETVNSRTAMHHAAVFQCSRVLAESIGSLPISLHVSDGTKRQKALTHAVHKVISESPNSFQTAVEFWEMCMLHLCFRGNFYAYQVRTGAGKLGELIPLHPDAVSPTQNNDYTITYGVTFLDGTVKKVEEQDMFHVKIFSLDGVLGMNPIEYARNTIGLSMALESHGAKMFKQGARPSGVLSTEASLTPAQAKEHSQVWNDAHSGENSGKTAVIGNGLKYQQIALSAVDSQWLENRKFQKSDIAAFYRVPPHKINDLEDATFSNIEHQSLEFVRDSLNPYAVKIEQRIKKSLLNDKDRASGHYAKFNFNSLLRGDSSARSQYYKDMIGNGVLSPNEVRALEDLNPRDGGDSYLTPMNMAIDGKLPETATSETKE